MVLFFFLSTTFHQCGTEFDDDDETGVLLEQEAEGEVDEDGVELTTVTPPTLVGLRRDVDDCRSGEER